MKKNRGKRFLSAIILAVLTLTLLPTGISFAADPQEDAVIRTVTFFGADGTLLSTEQVNEGETCPEPANPAIPDDMVSFRGWYYADETGEIQAPYVRFDFGTEITEDIYLTARFSDSYLVRFLGSRDDDALVIDSKEVRKNNTVSPTEEEVVPPTGSTFVGWTADKTTDALFDFSQTVTSDMDLYPVFGELCYVYYDTQGGSSVTTQVVVKNSTTSAPAAPTRPGYNFLYWSAEPNGSQFNFNTPVDNTMTLYAVWSANKVGYTVTIWVEDANEAGVYKAQTSYRAEALAGTSVKLTAGDIPGRYMPDYTEFSHSDPEKVVWGTGNTVVNVYCSRIVYRIYFDLNGSGAQMTYNGTTYTNGGDLYYIDAKYEQDISDIWPLHNENGYAMSRRDDGDTYYFYGWAPPENLGFSSSTWVSKRIQLSEGMIPSSGRSYTVSAQWIES